MKRALLFSSMCILLLALGCSSLIDISDSQYKHFQGDYDGAYNRLLEKKQVIVKKQGPIILHLDTGVLSHLSGDYEISNTLLSLAEKEIQEAYTSSISKNIASYLVNDNTIEYQGEDYEDIYINVFKALNYVHLGEEESALVELNRSIEKQSLLKQKYETQIEKISKEARLNGGDRGSMTTYSSSFSSSALANYLSMVVARGVGEENLFTYSLNQVRSSFETQPTLYSFSLPNSLVDEKNPIPRGKARLNIVAFNGLAPEKVEEIELYNLSNRSFMKIAYPVMQERGSTVHTVTISIENEKDFQLEKLESISSIAVETFKATSSLIKIKAIVRATMKAIGTEVYDDMIYRENNATLGEILLSSVFKVASFVSEQADVRTSHFLPNTAWVGGINLSPGEYTITILYKNYSGKTLFKETINNFKIERDKTNLLESYSPL